VSADEFPLAQELIPARFAAWLGRAAETCVKPHTPKANINSVIPKRDFIVFTPFLSVLNIATAPTLIPKLPSPHRLSWNQKQIASPDWSARRAISQVRCRLKTPKQHDNNFRMIRLRGNFETKSKPLPSISSSPDCQTHFEPSYRWRETRGECVMLFSKAGTRAGVAGA
jgi:hypothetical protein